MPTKVSAKPLVATPLTPSQSQFSQALAAQLNNVPSIPSTMELLNYPAGFNYGINPGASSAYNVNTLQDFDRMVELDANGQPTLSDNMFSTTYYKILSAASYQYSTADQAVLSNPALQTQQGAVVAAAVSTGYTAAYPADFPSAVVTYAQVLTSVMNQFNKTGSLISTSDVLTACTALNAMGYSGLGTAITTALSQLAPVNAIANAMRVATLELNAALNNSQNPTAANGGFAISPTGSAYYVGWTNPPSGNAILGGLTGAGKISVLVTASSFTSNQSTLSIAGSVGIQVPIADILDVDFSASASYNMSKYTSAGSSLSIQADYTGVSMVQIDPLPLSTDNTTGWWDGTLIHSIVTATGNPNVSGFKLPVTGMYPIASTFGQGNMFSRVRTFLISNYPTVTLTFNQGQTSAITTDFTVGASLDVSLFGLFSLGSASANYNVQSVNTSASGTQVTVVLGPPAPSGTIPLSQQVCNVLGGAPVYPA
jgi:hypothetical protein